MEYSVVEKEIIGLNAIIETIDSMINRENFDVLGKGSDRNILFHTPTHQKYFSIILVDFLSRADQLFTTESKTCFEMLEDICNSPHFDQDSSVRNLKSAISEFSKWLNKEVEIEVWLSSIEMEAQIKLNRIEFIEFCGNLSKHNYTRLTRTAKKLIAIYERNGIKTNLEDVLMSLDDFYERFHLDIFNYHASAIAEMLNNIRLAIFEYLLPEYKRSKTEFWDERINIMSYKYEIPEGIETGFAKACYWDLMNDMRNKPNFDRFEVTKYLKLRY